MQESRVVEVVNDKSAYNLLNTLRGHPSANVRFFRCIRSALVSLNGVNVMVNVVVLDLRSNNIRKLPFEAEWGSLTSLRRLHLDGNKVEALRSLVGLRRCPRLEILSARSNPITAHPEYRHFIVNTIPSLKLLDDFIVSDEEVIEGGSFPGHFGTMSSELRYRVGEIDIGTRWHAVQKILNADFHEITQILKHHSPVTMIQRHWRGYALRMELREKAIRRVQAAILVQRGIRRWLARRHQKAVVIQQTFRKRRQRIEETSQNLSAHSVSSLYVIDDVTTSVISMLVVLSQQYKLPMKTDVKATDICCQQVGYLKALPPFDTVDLSEGETKSETDLANQVYKGMSFKELKNVEMEEASTSVHFCVFSSGKVLRENPALGKIKRHGLRLRMHERKKAMQLARSTKSVNQWSRLNIISGLHPMLLTRFHMHGRYLARCQLPVPLTFHPHAVKVGLATSLLQRTMQRYMIGQTVAASPLVQQLVQTRAARAIQFWFRRLQAERRYRFLNRRNY